MYIKYSDSHSLSLPALSCPQIQPLKVIEAKGLKNVDHKFSFIDNCKPQ